ncbi:MAG TPA: hypothetical protein VL966_03630 [Alphaproteobacteria bacterium]|nr:hypothetical protein [Alphaproteobacteria bacterium]
MSTPTSQPPSDEVGEFIREQLESAGMSGLCREGCLEVAVSQLRLRYPEIDTDNAWALVRAIDSKSDADR